MTDEAHTTFTGVDLGMGSGDYWAAQCFDCHWTGSSKDCDGGLPNCDAGDYSDLECPRCGSKEIDEAPLKHQCVGIPLTSNQIDAIHKGQLDFRNGHWVFEREFFTLNEFRSVDKLDIRFYTSFR